MNTHTIKAYKVGPAETEEDYLVFAANAKYARLGFCRIVGWASEFDREHPCYISAMATRTSEYDSKIREMLNDSNGWENIEKDGLTVALVPPENPFLMAGLVIGPSYCETLPARGGQPCPNFVKEAQNV